MHIFHKWETIKEGECKVTIGGLLLPKEGEVRQGIATLQKCKKCPKERAWIQLMGETKREVHPAFLRDW